MEQKVFVNGSDWRYKCPKCGAYGECQGEDACYTAHGAEVKEYCYCAECGTYYYVAIDMVYKHTIIDENEVAQ